MTNRLEWGKEENQNMMLLTVTIRFQKYWNQIRARVWKWIRNSDEEQFDEDINGSIEEEYTDDYQYDKFSEIASKKTEVVVVIHVRAWFRYPSISNKNIAVFVDW